MSNISLADVRALEIPVPPKQEQHEIVRRVDALFALADAIESRVTAATARAEQLTQSILAKAFRGELVPTEAELARRDGRDYEPASVLLERIQAERDAQRQPSPTKKARPDSPQEVRRGASRPFQQAAIMALIVQRLAGPGTPAPSRFRVQKHMYFLERRQGNAPDADFAKHAAGPYNPKLRYGGAENIAIKQRGWLVRQGAGFKPGPNVEEAVRYASGYVDGTNVDWLLNQFHSYGDTALERWSTVDYAAYELRERGLRVTPATIVSYLGQDADWAKKLTKPGFTEQEISKTLGGLRIAGLA